MRRLEDKRRQETKVTIHILASGFWPFDTLTALSKVEGLLTSYT